MRCAPSKIPVFGLVVALALVSSKPAFGQHTLTMVEENGPADNRIDLLLMGDGFDATEQEEAASELDSAAENLFAHTPFSGYRQLFNIVRITTVSPESGADQPKEDEYVDTYFDCEFDYYDVDHLIWCDHSIVFAVAEELYPEYDFVILVVNELEYGGSGGEIAVVSTSNWAKDIPPHELGHTIAGLGDEYDTPFPGWVFEDIYPNISPTAEREALKWRAWVDAETPLPTPDSVAIDEHTPIGAYEGAMYEETGLYRPAPSCLMRDLDDGFCPICAEAMVVSYYAFVEPVDGATPPPGAVAGVSGESIDLYVEAVMPEPDTLVFEWSIGDQLIAGEDGPALSVPVECLEPGAHPVTLLVSDTTDLVRNDPHSLLSQQLDWTLERTDDGPTVPCPELFEQQPGDAGATYELSAGTGACECDSTPGRPLPFPAILNLLTTLFV